MLLRGTHFAVLSMLVMVLGCSQGEPTFTTGAVQLRGAGQMKRYMMAAKQWRLSEDLPVEQLWQFDRGGKFSAWIEGESKQDLSSLFPEIPTGAQKISGKWRVTTSELQLRNVIASNTERIGPLTLALHWVDGKLRIEIGGHHYIRVAP